MCRTGEAVKGWAMRQAMRTRIGRRVLLWMLTNT